MKNKKERFLYVLWIVVTLFVFGLICLLGKFSFFQNFFERLELNTFDIRQNIISKHKTVSDDIVIIEIDNPSYEYIMDKYSWPLSRGIFANVISALENAKAKYLVFDLLFLKPNLDDIEGDRKFIRQIKNNNNIYLSMIFDNYSEDIRISPVLDDKFKIKTKNTSKFTSNFYSFSNAKTIMKELLSATDKVGGINIIRDNDGIIRKIIPIYGYKNELYPNLTLKVALDILNKNEIEINKNNIVIDENHIIPTDKNSSVILNWYGKSRTFKRISFWEVLKATKENNNAFLEDNFKNKIIYIGTTATGLNDIKSTPLDYNFAGVEIHTTFLNNLLDNNFIQKTPFKTDLIIAILLCILTGLIVLKIQNIFKTFVAVFSVLGIYLIISTEIMHLLNIWVGIVLPFVSVILTFIGIYMEKYFLVTRDYEQTYKLAVTDGLTGLYNHRYFQEQMLLAVNNYHRYGNKFSLILIDIDFFKKFNDTYGHQSGDCVLKQVANILKKNSRTSDVACRYGGEEMSIILLNTSKEEAVITANKICSAVREHEFNLLNNETVHVTISVGTATAGIDGVKVQELIEYSDKCLYKAKESGRNQVVSNI